jgi:hypothetical protein
MLYDKGQGVAQDFSEAMNWYRKAADQGYGLAENDRPRNVTPSRNVRWPISRPIVILDSKSGYSQSGIGRIEGATY